MNNSNLIDGRPLKFATFGIAGDQGSRISRFALDLGYELIGGIDIRDAVGKPASAYVKHEKLADGKVKVYDSFENLFADAGKPDIVLMCALIPLPMVVDLSCRLLKQGINVIALDEALPDPDLAQNKILNDAAEEGGVTFMAGGFQDLWWIQFPDIISAASHNVTQVCLDHFSNLGMSSKEDGSALAAIGFTEKEYDVWAEKVLSDPANAVMAPSIKQLCRKMGLTPKKMTFDVKRYASDSPKYWWRPGIMIDPGLTTGVLYTSELTTEEGVLFCGNLEWEVRDKEETTYNAWKIKGEHDFDIRVDNLDAQFVTSTGVLRRIKDVVLARPGLITMADLPAPGYMHRVV